MGKTHSVIVVHPLAKSFGSNKKVLLDIPHHFDEDDCNNVSLSKKISTGGELIMDAKYTPGPHSQRILVKSGFQPMTRLSLRRPPTHTSNSQHQRVQVPFPPKTYYVC
ncbi:hypothetical protein HNY73_005040 [Argiope bruennichi]|uniref:Uncharacterized protein n=1 Tax=Argiope bruennichi TaxID=94029 RepID=A0A8T0FFY0_ARGBR|nr:hypothetical protein HNY73_005040 [Argiope bruennichi]